MAIEKVKQALDAARAAQESGGRSPRGFGARRRSVETGPIDYHTTRSVDVDTKQLAANRLLMQSADLAALNAYRVLRTQVLKRLGARKWSLIGVTSPTPEDGKSLTASNLAISLSREAKHTALLVDLDLVNPSLHKLFGLEPELGVSDYLTRDDVELSDVLVNPAMDGLVILPGREKVSDASEMLSTPKVVDLLVELQRRYDNRVVICDLPPVLGGDSVISVAPSLDCLLFVIREGKTREQDAELALEMIGDTPLIGSVLNGSEESSNLYY